VLTTAEVSERALREIYLKPFEIAIKESQPWVVMTSYNRVNGLHASDTKRLIDGVLRNEWKWQGQSDRNVPDIRNGSV
jgi:beta-glucosidase